VLTLFGARECDVCALLAKRSWRTRDLISYRMIVRWGWLSRVATCELAVQPAQSVVPYCRLAVANHAFPSLHFALSFNAVLNMCRVFMLCVCWYACVARFFTSFPLFTHKSQVDGLTFCDAPTDIRPWIEAPWRPFGTTCCLCLAAI